MTAKRNLWFTIVTVVVAAAIVVGVVFALRGSPSKPTTAANATITFAEAPGASPNYIFPYMSCQYFSVSTINQFDELMQRPLYWFGKGGSSAYVPSLSFAQGPVFSNGNKTVTIAMKGWKFADGQTVNSRSVMFFLNMYKADPKSYCGYNPGYGIPDQVASASAQGSNVVIDFKTSVNPGWILYNYLSEITPMPDSWDKTSATATSTCATGAYGAAATDTACKAVETYLDAQSAKTSTYTDAMWQSGDDGPWRLTAFDNLGNATFKPNTKYSGPQKAQVSTVKLVSYTTTQAEENDLQAGKIDIGFVDQSVLTQPAPSPGAVGPNWASLASKYNLVTGPLWDFNYAPFNFSKADPKVAAVDQLYIRQALQLAVDQTGVITKVDKGYGFPTYSPLPPRTPSSISGPVANPYPFNLAAAKALLTSHGWTEKGGVMTCTRPGIATNECGSGITSGYTLNFKIVWASGTPSLDQTFAAEISDWAKIGVTFAQSTESFDSVIKDCSGGSGYELCSWGGGWVYAPDYYPSGETLFAPSGGFNVGTYSNAQMTSLIKSTTFGTAKLTSFASYAAEQLPVLYEPQAITPGEIIKTLKSTIGFTPNPLGNFMPEYLHF
ncbi:MAG TPA: ABC transporter substrate-binding protein [Acidimicrobiales bacterium]|nr:ABC transporter substrate-binding protein [Acidimicrobiales bacterium]